MKKEKLGEKYSAEELAEGFVFKTALSEKKASTGIDQLNAARQRLRKEMTSAQALHAGVLQLRFLMEDYVKSDTYDQSKSFGSFLRQYMKLKYRLIQDFAQDIHLNKSELSSILQNKRLPSEKTIIRLEIHSRNMISAVQWYRLLEKEKEHKLQTNYQLRETEDKFVRHRLDFDK